ncbi:unnamed protein product [Taenia asiatica]|uniref:BPTI/Kunitz inhibitor domain-containing protein n=1 Tax=Taenia asiatica TaxID=60517 RepID=A0A0R3VYV6_TAEAS|nr:unnamed protein product [Taenia asiatica]
MAEVRSADQNKGSCGLPMEAACNRSIGRCESFYYSSCQGSCRDVRCGANAYCTNGRCFCQQGYEGDPQIECRPSYQGEDVCSLPTVVGSCSGSIQRYTYNRSTGRCEAFYYSGCHGNANNFENLEDCQRQCESSYPQGESHDLTMEGVFEPS